MKVKMITMVSYLLKCKKMQEVLIQVFHKLVMEEHGFYQKSTLCNSRRSRFIKEKEASRFFSKLATKNSFS